MGGYWGSWGTATYYRSVRPLLPVLARLWCWPPQKNGLSLLIVAILLMAPLSIDLLREKLRYENLLDIAATIEPPTEASLVQPKDFKYLGRSHELDHLNPIILGTAQYGIDQQVENMHYASIERCPVPRWTNSRCR